MREGKNMDNNQLQDKLIVISSFSDEGQRILIKDENGKSYSFFKKKQDGTESAAWMGYKQQQLEVSKKIGIKYQESKQTNQGGKLITYRNIRMFVPADDITMKAVEPVHEGKQVNWDEVSLGKCRHAFLLEAFEMGKPLTSQLVKDCNVWAQASMTGKFDDKQVMTENELDTPQYDVSDEDMNSLS